MKKYEDLGRVELLCVSDMISFLMQPEPLDQVVPNSLGVLIGDVAGKRILITIPGFAEMSIRSEGGGKYLLTFVRIGHMFQDIIPENEREDILLVRGDAVHTYLWAIMLKNKDWFKTFYAGDRENWVFVSVQPHTMLRGMEVPRLKELWFPGNKIPSRSYIFNMLAWTEDWNGSIEHMWDKMIICGFGRATNEEKERLEKPGVTNLNNLKIEPYNFVKEFQKLKKIKES